MRLVSDALYQNSPSTLNSIGGAGDREAERKPGCESKYWSQHSPGSQIFQAAEGIGAGS